MKDITPTPANQLAIATARLAENLGYQGNLTIGTLEDEIRFYQQRTVEACLEMGKRLLILREMCPHGEFASRLEILGFQQRTAQRFMQAVLKFSNTSTSTLLGKIDSQSKLLELITLDDDQLEALNNGESLGEITLDDIETMSVKELRKALKEARADNNAKEELLAGKDRKINELDSKLTVRKQPDQFKQVQIEVEQHINDELAQASASVLTAISQFNAKVELLTSQAGENFLPHLKDKIQQDISVVYNRIAQVGFEVGVVGLMKPDWLDTDSQPADIPDFELSTYTEADLDK